MPSNPCRGVRKPTRIKRERLISDDEYLAVHAVAGAAVKLAMVLALRTLAIPADILQLGPRNVHRLPDNRRVLRFARGKTGVQVEIEIVGELAALIDGHLTADVVFATFVHRRDGKQFTVDGIGAMFRRYCGEKKAGVADFGLRDLRAKGATDMYRGGADLRMIQKLLGHRSVRTTEIYLKSLVAETVRPNETPVVASVK
jgi:integrase